jgi:hypothetical protein
VREGVARNEKIRVRYIDHGKGAGIRCTSVLVGGLVSAIASKFHSKAGSLSELLGEEPLLGINQEDFEEGQGDLFPERC